MSHSIWMSAEAPLHTEPLQAHATVDVCVVGGGLAGLTTAYLLARAGRAVVLLEAGGIGAGTTARSTAHLTSAIDNRYDHIERLFGQRGAGLAAESRVAAIDRIEQLVRDEDIACGFERLDGYLVPADRADAREIEHEEEAALRAGLADVRKMARSPLGSGLVGPVLRFPDQGQLQPVRYLRGLAEAARRRGARIHTDTRVVDLHGGARPTITTDAGWRVETGALVLATHSPITRGVVIHVKQHAYMTYVVAGLVPQGSLPVALLWDTAEPYHYVRLARGREADEQPAWDVLLVGGEDHRVGTGGDADVRYQRLESWTRRHFPPLGEVVGRWAGEVLEPFDGLPFIGHNPGNENVFVATGFSGDGMTNGTIAGMLLCDLLTGVEDPWAELYDPLRVTVGAGATFLRENLETAAGFARWLPMGEPTSADEIPPGGGAVIRRGLARIAVHRREDGSLMEMSAVCTHLGCLVAWNAGERTWDCPCHGSRFDAEGQVVHGPAHDGLRILSGRPMGR